jgi:hypothetical protein
MQGDMQMRTSTRWLAFAGGAALALTLGLAVVATGPPSTPAAADPAGGSVNRAVETGSVAGVPDAEMALLAPELERVAGGAQGALRQRLLRLGGRTLVHAEVTLDREGTLVTFHLDRGTVTAVGSASLSIAQAGGGARTLATSHATRVRKDRSKATLAGLAKGDAVVVLSKVESGTLIATFILVPVPKAAVPAGGRAPAATTSPQPEG